MGAALAMLTAFANAVPFSFLMLSQEETILNYICLAPGDFNMNRALCGRIHDRNCQVGKERSSSAQPHLEFATQIRDAGAK